MSGTLSVTNDFTGGSPAVADDVDQNFSDIVSFVNTNMVHKDGTVAFTGVPSGPATNPSTDNQFARKRYVDDAIDTDVTAHETNFHGTEDITETMLATGSVTNTKLGDLAVTAAKIDANAVETAKIKDANVTYDKLQNAVWATGACTHLSLTAASRYQCTFSRDTGASSDIMSASDNAMSIPSNGIYSIQFYIQVTAGDPKLTISSDTATGGVMIEIGGTVVAAGAFLLDYTTLDYYGSTSVVLPLATAANTVKFYVSNPNAGVLDVTGKMRIVKIGNYVP